MCVKFNSLFDSEMKYIMLHKCYSKLLTSNGHTRIKKHELACIGL